MHYQVQLLNSTRTPVQQEFTNIDGEATFNTVKPGIYIAAVSGAAIENADVEFEVHRNEAHVEYVRVKLVQTGQALGSTEGSVSMASLAIPGKARKELDKGNKAAQQNDLQQAKQHFQKALELYPSYSAAANNLGAICLRLQDRDCARDSLEQAVRSDPRSAPALQNLARVRMAEQNFTQAEQLLQRALTVEPTNPEALVAMARIELVLQKYADAVFYAHKVHAVPHTGFGVAHWIAAEALEAQGKPQEAVVEYGTFLKEAPEHPFAPQARAALARLNQTAKESTQHP
jgi:tetratricopeptide (TPR) repeat protein